MENEAVAIRRKHERDIQRFGIAKGLLHTAANRLPVVLRFDDCDGDVGLGRKDVVGALALAATYHLAAHDNPPLGEADFFPNLRGNVPPGGDQRGSNEFRADIALAKNPLIQVALPNCSTRRPMPDATLLPCTKTSTSADNWLGKACS